MHVGKPSCFNVLYEEREDDFPGLQSESMPRKPEGIPRIATRKSQTDKKQERRIHNVGGQGLCTRSFSSPCCTNSHSSNDGKCEQVKGCDGPSVAANHTAKPMVHHFVA